MEIDSEPPEGQFGSSPPNFDLEELGSSENDTLPKNYPIQSGPASIYAPEAPSSDPLSKGGLVTSLSQRNVLPKAATPHRPPGELLPPQGPATPNTLKRARLEIGGENRQNHRNFDENDFSGSFTTTPTTDKAKELLFKARDLLV